MAKHDPKWTPDVDERPSTHPKTRDQLVQENRARREAEPAAAPQEADSESGTPSSVPLTPRTEPVRTTMVNASENDRRDVRAGPGDAGAASTPTQPTQPVSDRKDTWSRAIGIIAVALLIAAVVALLF
jgi:hypothetical protein